MYENHRFIVWKYTYLGLTWNRALDWNSQFRSTNCTIVWTCQICCISSYYYYDTRCSAYCAWTLNATIHSTLPLNFSTPIPPLPCQPYFPHPNSPWLPLNNSPIPIPPLPLNMRGKNFSYSDDRQNSKWPPKVPKNMELENLIKKKFKTENRANLSWF